MTDRPNPTQEWWTAEEIAAAALPDLPGTKRGVNVLADRADWRGQAGMARRRAGRGGGWEYSWRLFPARAKRKLLADAAAAVPGQPGRDEAWAWFEGLPGAVQDKARARLRIVQEAEALAVTEGKHLAVLSVARLHGIGARTIWGWLGMIEGVRSDDRLAYLAPRNRANADAAKARVKDCDPEFFDEIKSDFLRNEAPPFTDCYRRALRIAKAKGWATLPERTMRRRLDAAVSPAVQVLARQGVDALKRLFPVQVRDKTCLGALEAVNADFHKFDVFVRWPAPRGEAEQIIRPQMVAFQDIYSGRILSWRLDVSPNSTAVLLAAGDMITEWGIPEHVLLDNGREFAAKAITGGASTRYRFKVRDEDIPGLFTSLGCTIHWATPYSGQSKPIERAFRDLCSTISKDPRLAGAYTGNRPDAKPENYGSRAIALDDFLKVVAEGIEEHNTRQGRRSEVAWGRSFAEVFDESYAARPIKKATEGQRRLWLLAADRVRAHADTGAVWFQGNEFWSDWMHRIAGERVIVRFDPAAFWDGVHVYSEANAYGRPLERSILTEEVMGATLGGVRSPLTGYPGDGLTPDRLARILREADGGDPLRYMELAQTIEERDLHYQGVLGTRRRAVSQLDITVEAAEDGGEEGERWAKVVRKWLQRDELQADLFHILDAIGKGYSGTEIIWDASEGQYEPQRLEWRDPRWFRFETRDLTTPMRLEPDGSKVPLDAFKFVWAVMSAKSGLPLRSGLARAVAWAWMFKAYTMRDWTIFTQTYGQPVRVGKWGTGASEDDKAKLFRAVANIAGDMAAIIPDTMQIEFIEAANVGAGSTLYKDRANWLDQQVSKAVLGQTATTDAVTGGLGSGKEHRQVQEGIERADAKALSAILNRDLIGSWMALNSVPRAIWPRLKIGRPEKEDLAAFATAVTPFIDRGLPVSAATIREKFGLPEPAPEDLLLKPSGGQSGAVPGANLPAPADAADPAGQTSPIKRVSGVFKRGAPLPGMVAAPQALMPSGGPLAETDPVDVLTQRLAERAAPEMARLMEQIEAMVAAASSLEELREMMLAAFPDLDTASLGRVIAQGLLASHLGGRVAVVEEDDG